MKERNVALPSSSDSDSSDEGEREVGRNGNGGGIVRVANPLNFPMFGGGEGDSSDVEDSQENFGDVGKSIGKERDKSSKKRRVFNGASSSSEAANSVSYKKAKTSTSPAIAASTTVPPPPATTFKSTQVKKSSKSKAKGKGSSFRRTDNEEDMTREWMSKRKNLTFAFKRKSRDAKRVKARKKLIKVAGAGSK